MNCPRVVLSWLAGVVLVSPFAGAATIHVETLTDELVTNGLCSLREALMNANADNQGRTDCEAGSGADLVILPSGTVELGISGREENGNLTGDLDLTDSVTLRGQGAGLSAVDANGLDRVLHIQAGAASATVEDLALTGGAAILSNTEQLGGGGIAATGAALTIRRADVHTNNATSASNFLSVSGGGIFLSGAGTLTLEDTALRNNSTTDGDPGIGVRGGGLAALNSGSQVFLVRTTVSGNFASHSSSVFAQGGGIEVWGNLDIENCTVSDNTASTVGGGTANGGGIAYTEPLSGSGGVFENLTLSNNSATTGSGLYLEGSADLRNVVVAANGCSGGSVVSLGGNVESPAATCGFGAGVDDLENVTVGALALGPLQDNGGYTATRALGNGSVAIGNGTAAPCPATDQRGITRSAPCDSGAFEAVEIFSDGFAAGNTSAWSAQVPP